MWLFLLYYVYVVGSSQPYDVSTQTMIICSVGVISIIFSYLFGMIMQRSHDSGRLINRPNNERYLGLIKSCLKVTLGLGIIGAILSFYRWKSAGVNFSQLSFSLFYDMNLINSEEGGVIGGLTGRLVTLNLVTIIIASYLRLNSFISSRLYFFSIFISIVCLISPRRALLFYALSILFLTFFFYANYRFKTKILVSSVIIMVLIFLFGATQYYLGKLDNFDLASFYSIVKFYTTSSFVVMSELLNTQHFQDKVILLNTPARIINSLFSTGYNVDLSVPFVELEHRANTLPMFYYIFKELGYLGLILIGFLIGLAFSYVVTLTKRKGLFIHFSLSMLFMLGLMFSPREMIFITYDFWTWVFVVFFIDKFARTTILSKKLVR